MQKLKYANNKEFLEAFGKALAEAQQHYSKTELSLEQLVDIYISIADCKIVDYSNDYKEVLFPNYESQSYETDTNFLRKVISLVGQTFYLSARASDTQLKSLIKRKFYDNDAICQVVPAPSNVFSVKDGKIYDSSKHAYVDDDPHFYYHKSYDIDPLADIDTSSAYYKAVITLLQSWSKSNKTKMRNLLFIAYLAMLGHGASSIVFLTGSHGSGKSTFLKMIKNLVGNECSQVFDLNDICHNRKLSAVTPKTRLVYGHALHSNYEFNARETVRLKILAVSNPINQYLPAFKNPCLKIQETSSLPSFTGKLLDNLLIEVNFGTTNYIRKSGVRNEIEQLTGESIQGLIKNQKFLDMIALITLKEFNAVEQTIKSLK